MKIALFIKESIETSDELSTLLISKINEYNLEFDQDNPDVVIVVGGDGTLLRAIHEYFPLPKSVSFVGVNQGNLGFACDYEIDELDSLFCDLISNNVDYIDLNVIKANFEEREIFALNEIRIENPFHTLACEVFVDKDMLELFRGNGLVVSSSFGSSGYNKSLGGAVIPSNLNLMQLKEIAPITNRVYQSLNSSLILSSNNIVTLKGDFQDCVIGYDHLTMPADGINEIKITSCEKKATIIYKHNHSYFAQLKEAFIK